MVALPETNLVLKVTFTSFSTPENGQGIECCHDGLEIIGPNRHAKCFPITIPLNDPFYGPRKVYCMNFIRSMQSVNDDCTFGPAEQVSKLGQGKFSV